MRAVAALGAARGEEAAVRSGPGHRAHTTRQQVLFLLGASSFSSHHPPAAPHTRQGVVISKRPMVATHQRERGSVVSGGGRGLDGEIRAPSFHRKCGEWSVVWVS